MLIDNFDSFTYNLVQMFQVLGKDVAVLRNDGLSVHECLEKKPSHIVISPGPGHPSQSGIAPVIIQACANQGIPLLGVCLGHQCLAAALGGKIRRAKKPMHGKVSRIKHNGKRLFAYMPDLFEAARYHSLAVEDLPAELEVDALAEDGEIMAISHAKLPLFGVQFHPESLATQHGAALLLNFLKVNYV